MELAFNSFSLTLLVTGTLVGVLSLYIAFLLKDTIRLVAVIMLCVSVWGFFYGLELASLSLSDMVFWVKFQYIGICLAPVCWLYFCFKYTDYSLKKRRLFLPLLCLVPVLTYVLLLTSDSHQLIYRNLSLNTSGPFPILDIVKGPWYFLNVGYAYLLFASGVVVLWKRFRFSDPLYKTQTKLIITAGIFPLAFNFLYQTKIIAPYSGIDLTTYAFLFTYIILGVAIIRFNLFSIKPIARDIVMEAIPKGVLVLDASNLVVDFNQAMLDFIPNGEKLKVVTNGIEPFFEISDLYEFIKKGEKGTIESEVFLKGDSRVLKTEIIPLFDRKSILSGKMILFEDITSQIKINNQLASQAKDLSQLNDLKDKFFSIISHDLKGPVFGVSELIHLAKTGIISNEEFMEMLPEISKNMANVSILLENLLAWSSSQLRGEQIYPEKFEIKKSLIHQKDLLERISSEKGIKVMLDEGPDTLVFADKTMIELVLRNLISNGIKFSKKGGEIHLSVETVYDSVRICVRDFGAGITEENLEKLRSGISFTTNGQNNESGTGLGLVLVREYLEKNNGTLEISSLENEGSTFCIHLPLHKEKTEELISVESGNS